MLLTKCERILMNTASEYATRKQNAFTDERLSSLFDFMTLCDIRNLGLADRDLGQRILFIKKNYPWVHHSSRIFSIYVQRKVNSEKSPLSYPCDAFMALAEQVKASIVPSAIHSITLKECDVELSKMIEQLPNLHTLHLSRSNSNDLFHLRSYTTLKNLQCDATSNITDSALEHLTVLSQLQNLTLVSCNITDEGLVYLSGLTMLQGLNLMMMPIKGTRLSALKCLPALKQLRLSYCLNIKDSALRSLDGFHSLEELDLSSAEISDTALEVLSQLSLPHLKTIDFSECKKITERGIAYLTALPSLHTVILKKTWLPPKIDFNALRTRQQLKNVSLS